MPILLRRSMTSSALLCAGHAIVSSLSRDIVSICVSEVVLIDYSCVRRIGS